MPKYNLTEDDLYNIKLQSEEVKKQETAPGIEVIGGEITHSDFDSKDWHELLKDYTNMVNGDSVAGTTLDMLKAPIMNADKNIMPGDDSELALEAVDYANWCFDTMWKGFDYLKSHKLTALDFGLSLHEVITKNGVEYRTKEGKKKLTTKVVKLSPIEPETIFKFKYNKDTVEFDGIEHEKRIPDEGSIFIDIEADKLNLWTWRESFNDIRGKSVLRPARMAWDSKRKVLNAKVTGTQRGAGLVVVETIGNPQDASTVKKIGRTLTQAVPNAYTTYDNTKYNVKLLEPKNQADVMELLEFLNREMFFNTMTQFMTSGLGQNGSRAAASELKSSYELAINSVIAALEQNLQALLDLMINISYLGNMPKESRPIFKFASIREVDLTKTADNLKKLYEATLLQPNQEDKVYIREIFGLPETITDNGDVATDEEDQAEEIKAEGCGCGNHQLGMNLSPHRELHEHEKNVFELESAKAFYLEVQEKSQKIMDSVIDKMFNDIYNQVKADKNNSINIRFQGELTARLTKLYESGFEIGQEDIDKELKKIGASDRKLALTPKGRDRKNKSINRWVGRLAFNIKTTLEDALENTSIDRINKKGGIKPFVESYKDGFKGDKRRVLQETDSGYVDGRGKTLRDRAEEVGEVFYSAILDGNLCDVCAPFDGAILTVKEAQDNDLQFSSPTNLNCEGGQKCRCVLVPFTTRN